jgi:hypothetical protein
MRAFIDGCDEGDKGIVWWSEASSMGMDGAG